MSKHNYITTEETKKRVRKKTRAREVALHGIDRMKTNLH
jgi:hypothetical protein